MHYLSLVDQEQIPTCRFIQYMPAVILPVTQLPSGALCPFFGKGSPLKSTNQKGFPMATGNLPFSSLQNSRRGAAGRPENRGPGAGKLGVAHLRAERAECGERAKKRRRVLGGGIRAAGRECEFCLVVGHVGKEFARIDRFPFRMFGMGRMD